VARKSEVTSGAVFTLWIIISPGIRRIISEIQRLQTDSPCQDDTRAIGNRRDAYRSQFLSEWQRSHKKRDHRQLADDKEVPS